MRRRTVTLRLLLTGAAVAALPTGLASQTTAPISPSTSPANAAPVTPPKSAPVPAKANGVSAEPSAAPAPAPVGNVKSSPAAKPVKAGSPPQTTGKPRKSGGSAEARPMSKPLTRAQRRALAQAARTPERPSPRTKGAGPAAVAATALASTGKNAGAQRPTNTAETTQPILAPPAATAPASPPGTGPTPTAPPAIRIPGFAAELAQRPNVTGPTIWTTVNRPQAWRALARARGIDKQRVRWDYARGLIGQNDGSEAFGVLEVMRQDDPDLAMVDAFRIARAASMVLIGRNGDAVAELSTGFLTANPEACAWRLRALSAAGMAEQALSQLDCARPAINARSNAARRPFILSVARSGVEHKNPGMALNWLKNLADRDSPANLYRARAYLALGQQSEARLRFARVEKSGSKAEQMDARLSQIEAKVAARAIGVPAALAQLTALRFAWRGDHVEERALQLSYRLSVESNDLYGALNAGAILFRFFDLARQEQDFLPGLQARLAGALDETSGLPLDKAAGLYWDYRDLTPSGAQGDYLVSRLGDRLQSAGLYGRAAELFEHQLFVRAGELAKGPLSAKVATLHILAGHPDRALAAIRKSASSAFTDDMIHARKQVEAIALSQVGKVEEAFAVLQDVPNAQVLRAEILWNRRDWEGFAIEAQRRLPTAAASALSEVQQAEILRYAISLAMLAREQELAELRARYAPSFAGRATGPVFDMLTAALGSVDPAALAGAMAALPAVSPAGELAELVEAGVKPKTAA